MLAHLICVGILSPLIFYRSFLSLIDSVILIAVNGTGKGDKRQPKLNL